MPLKPIDYSKTIFYRIVCNDLNIKDCYVGHTTNFIKRKQNHKDCCNNDKKYNLKVYQFIRENGGWNNWSMIMIEQISCENFNEASKLERKFLEEFNGTLNSLIPSRTSKEYYEKNIGTINKIKKEYNEKNKEKIKEQKKEYYENNKEKIKEHHKEYNIKYYEKNKEKIKEQKKKYYEKNKLVKKPIEDQCIISIESSC